MDEHSHNSVQKHLGLAIALNAVIFVVELVGGLLTNSLALISDAMHNLSDFFALILSYAASKIVLWKSNAQKSYGYVRVEIFVAFINAVTLVLIGGYIIYEGIMRFKAPEPVMGLWMMIIAVIGFAANTFSTLILRKDAEHDLNAKSAFLHLLTDAIESLGVIVVGALIYWRGWFILDPIISIAIGIFIIKSAWDILLETVNILTEGTPKGIDLERVAAFIRSFPEVDNVHHLHIWSLSSSFRALSAHLVVKDRLISAGCAVTKKLEAALEKEFAINHPTLQLEAEVCEAQDVVVDINNKTKGGGNQQYSRDE
jgi:cobalt-zinc-cadmium efflux system protein